ncbi:hypothetical protein [Methanosarcina acetivorans]|uniref:Uncharacterized protein n=1 Tax=Methanosarcina acetivorans (strain ATCC 35395 / DSM 2834 / JCM 12185 / C2A) TaxID=188937 RepID=Q8TTK8_METAC|nr:hypothetical protein [Methanosarcina acetivorans]AAM03870.1 predicted protein [Methanosarcina acetivorans C2A]
MPIKLLKKIWVSYGGGPVMNICAITKQKKVGPGRVNFQKKQVVKIQPAFSLIILKNQCLQVPGLYVGPSIFSSGLPARI